MSLDELMQAANELDETELDRLLQRIVTLRAQRKAHGLPAEEADLLDRINQGVPADLRAEYQALRAKREAKTLTEADHEQLIQLSNQISSSPSKPFRPCSMPWINTPPWPAVAMP